MKFKWKLYFAKKNVHSLFILFFVYRNSACRNLATFYNLRANSANPDISRFFFQPSEFSTKFRLGSICGRHGLWPSLSNPYTPLRLRVFTLIGKSFIMAYGVHVTLFCLANMVQLSWQFRAVQFERIAISMGLQTKISLSKVGYWNVVGQCRSKRNINK